MSFKSSRGRNLGKELEIFMSTKIGLSIGSEAESTESVSSSGGTTFIVGNDRYHVFTSDDTLETTGLGPKTVDVLVVGGGGGGGRAMGAGGGAGGLIFHPGAPGSTFSGTIAITVGGGGAGSPGGLAGANGGNSSVGTAYTALGGGGGNRYSSSSPHFPALPISIPDPATPVNQGCRGGSGGGGGGLTDGTGGVALQTTYAPLPADSRTYGFGNNGGSTTVYEDENYYSRAGGGGAGTAGGNNAIPNISGGTGTNPGPGKDNWGWGGDGKSIPAPFVSPDYPATVITALGGVPTSSPEWTYFAGGGGAGSNGGPATAGLLSNGINRGGLGNNAGPGAPNLYGFGSHNDGVNSGNGANGCPGRGGGGGGGKWAAGTGGNGGGGCVIIKINNFL